MKLLSWKEITQLNIDHLEAETRLPVLDAFASLARRVHPEQLRKVISEAVAEDSFTIETMARKLHDIHGGWA
jgi:hypothetical protein